MTTPPPNYPPYPQQPYGAPQPQPMSPADERLWATLIHVGSIFFTLLAPLIGYLILKDRGPFIRAHAATALNFQITMIIAGLVGFVLTFVIIGIFVLIAVGIVMIVFPIIAAVKANQGQWYTYPLAIRFIS